MKFKNTYRFSPIHHENDLPWEWDLFHVNHEEVPDTPRGNAKAYEDFVLKGGFEVDAEWWYKQESRCRNGYVLDNIIEPGGDLIVDEQDAFWNESKKYPRYLQDWEMEVPPNSILLPEYDLIIKDGKVPLTNRHYFFLNFWKIFAIREDIEGLVEGETRKDIVIPRFTDLDWLFYHRINLAFKKQKDDTEAKSRQKGYSEKMGGGMLGYNFLFLPASQNVVAGGMSDDAEHTFENFTRGLEILKNTQFHKYRSKSDTSGGHFRASKFKSEVMYISCKDNAQALSRLSPTLVIYEEVGKWKKGLIREARQFVNASLYAQGRKTGLAIYIGCVCEGTMVYDQKGNMLEIEKLKMKDGILGFDQQKGLVSKEPISYWQETFEKPCYRVTTSTGRELECSEDHPLLVRKRYENQFKTPRRNTEWSRTDDIQKGWLLAVPEKIDVWGDEDIFDPRFIGLLIGDGTYGLTNWEYVRKDGTKSSGKSGNIVLANADQEVWNYVESRYKTSLSCKSTKTKDGRILHKKIVQSVYSEIDKLGIRGQTKKNKRVPKALFSAGKEAVCEFLGGLYDSDGCVYVKEDTDRYVVIKLSQANRQILLEVMYLLNKLGIHGKISYNKPDRNNAKSYNGHYDLCIKDKRSVINFYENISFLISDKQQKLSHAYKTVLKRTKDKSVIPELKGLRFERVVKIEYIGKKPIYNLTADKTHTYLANGIVTHNTGGDMEQGAADLERIHYRPHKYNALSFKNKWEEEEMPSDAVSGNFTPDWVFRIIDEHGNSIKQPSLELYEKELSDQDDDDVQVYYTQHAIYAANAFLSKGGGFFNKKVIGYLNTIKSKIIKHKEYDVVKQGRLEWIYEKDEKTGRKYIKGIEFVADENGPHKIIEHPQKDPRTEKPYLEVYKAGTDSYDKDESNVSTSKLSTHIYKTFISPDHTSNLFVASLNIRPDFVEGGAKKAYEESAKLCYYYNAKNLIEWSNIRIFGWYEEHGFAYLLKERPELVLASWIENSQVVNRYGVDPSTKHHWLAMLNDNLFENWEKLRDLDQIMAYLKFKLDKNYNCDITISSSLAVVHAEDDKRIMIDRMQSNESGVSDNWFGKGFKMVGDQIIKV